MINILPSTFVKPYSGSEVTSQFVDRTKAAAQTVAQRIVKANAGKVLEQFKKEEPPIIIPTKNLLEHLKAPEWIPHLEKFSTAIKEQLDRMKRLSAELTEDIQRVVDQGYMSYGSGFDRRRATPEPGEMEKIQELLALLQGDSLSLVLSEQFSDNDGLKECLMGWALHYRTDMGFLVDAFSRKTISEEEFVDKAAELMLKSELVVRFIGQAGGYNADLDKVFIPENVLSISADRLVVENPAYPSDSLRTEEDAVHHELMHKLSMGIGKKASGKPFSKENGFDEALKKDLSSQSVKDQCPKTEAGIQATGYYPTVHTKEEKYYGVTPERETHYDVERYHSEHDFTEESFAEIARTQTGGVWREDAWDLWILHNFNNSMAWVKKNVINGSG